MAKSIPDQLSMFHLMTSSTSTNATSSQESQDGHTHSDLQDGQMTEKSGRVAARASRLALQEKVKELTMNGTYGRTSFDSLEAVAPQSSWVNRLQERLGMVGSTESDLIWKLKATPAKALIFRLAPQTRRISGQDYIGWRTPTTRDGMQSGYADMEKLANRWERGKQVQLCDQVRMEHKTWPTPNAEDAKAGQSQLPTRQQSSLPRTVGATQSGSTEQTEKRGVLNPTFVCWLMGFPPEWESCAPTAMQSSRRSRQK
jgi:hypothetical protein